MKNKTAIFSLCFIIVSLAAFYLSFFKIANHDIWFHIKTGEIIFNNFTLNKDFLIPRQEIFSHTMKGVPWIAHEWLFGLISFLIYSFSGATGLILIKSIVISLAYILLFRIIYDMTDDSAISLLFTIIPVCLSRFRFFERPDIFSFLFLAVMIYALLNIRKGKKFPLLILPLVTVIWVNIHGAMGILCPAILFLYYISRFVDEFMKKPRGMKKIGELLKNDTLLAGIIILSFLCLLVNPSFMGVIIEGKDILFSHNIKNVVQVPEWMPPGAQFIGFWIYLVLSCIVLVLTFRLLDTYNLLLFIIFALGAISASRNIPLFAMTSAPILANHIKFLLGKLSKTKEKEVGAKHAVPRATSRSPLHPLNEYWENIYQASIIVLSLIVLAISLWNAPPYIQFGTGIKAGAFPEGAVKFIKDNKIMGKMYNTHWYGGYLAFSLYPEYEIFIDGRNTIFTPLWQKFRCTPWDKVLDEYGVNVAILDFKKDSLYKFFRASTQWNLIYFDDYSVIFVKSEAGANPYEKLFYKYLTPEMLSSTYSFDIGANKTILDEALRHTKEVPQSYEAHFYAGNLYLAMGEFPKAEEYLANSLKLNSDSEDAHIALGYIMTNTGRMEEGLKHFDEALRINPKVQGKIYGSLADKYAQLGDLEKAIDMMNKAIKEDPENPALHRKLGNLYEKAGDMEESEKHNDLAKKYQR